MLRNIGEGKRGPMRTCVNNHTVLQLIYVQQMWGFSYVMVHKVIIIHIVLLGCRCGFLCMSVFGNMLLSILLILKFQDQQLPIIFYLPDVTRQERGQEASNSFLKPSMLLYPVILNPIG